MRLLQKVGTMYVDIQVYKNALYVFKIVAPPPSHSFDPNVAFFIELST